MLNYFVQLLFYFFVEKKSYLPFIFQVNIMENGEVCLEFVKQKQKVEKVMEVFVISPDGMSVKIYQPNHGKGEPISDHPLPLPESPTKQFTFDELPEKYWKKYQYAARLVLSLYYHIFLNHFNCVSYMKIRNRT